MRVATELYAELRECRDFGLRDQIQRAAVSIPSNVAEGFDRQTNKEFINFLHIARGSCAELRTQLYLATRLETLAPETGNRLIEETKQISKMLTALIKTRRERFS